MRSRVIIFFIFFAFLLGGLLGYLIGFGKSLANSLPQDNATTQETEDEQRTLTRSQLLGIWQSQDTTGLSLEFLGDERYNERTNGSLTSTGRWEIVQNTANEPINLPAISGITVLKITTAKVNYFLVDILENQLSLFNLQTNREELYSR